MDHLKMYNILYFQKYILLYIDVINSMYEYFWLLSASFLLLNPTTFLLVLSQEYLGVYLGVIPNTTLNNDIFFISVEITSKRVYIGILSDTYYTFSSSSWKKHIWHYAEENDSKCCINEQEKDGVELRYTIFQRKSHE